MFGVTRHVRVTIISALLLATGLSPLGAQAATVTPLRPAQNPRIIITEVQIGGATAAEEFIELYNLTDQEISFAGPTAKDAWKLQFFSATSTVAGTPDWTKPAASLGLTGTIAAHGYYVLTAGDYKLSGIVGDQTYSARLSEAGGGLQVVEPTTDSLVSHDHIMWQKPAIGKTLASDVYSTPTNNGSLQRMPTDDDTYVTRGGTFTTFMYQAITTPGDIWAVITPDTPHDDPDDPTTDTSNSEQSPGQDAPVPGLPQDATQPPASPDAPTETSPEVAEMPSNPDTSAIGLPTAQTPVISELLPNPASPAKDETDEYIELYNPGSVNFDLVGYSLQAGITTLHTYTFKESVSIPAGGYKTIYAATSHLSLTNTASQVQLLDPSGKPVGQSDKYDKAEEGTAWALESGVWQWTTKPTPGAKNEIVPPLKAATQSNSKSASAATAAVAKTTAKATSTSPKLSTKQTTAKAAKATASKVKSSVKTKIKKATTKKAKKTAKKSTMATVANTSKEPERAPVHNAVLVSVGSLAVLYAAYEYRNDIRNLIFKFKRNRGHRQFAR